MGLTAAWARVATSRPHVLVVEAPGAFRLRAALERAVDSAGWCRTHSVADADVLAVVGEPGPDLLAVIEHSWDQLSEPRARLAVGSAGELSRWTGRGARRARCRPRTNGHRRAGGHRRRRHLTTTWAGTTWAGTTWASTRATAAGTTWGGWPRTASRWPRGPTTATVSRWTSCTCRSVPCSRTGRPGVVLRLTLHGDVVAAAEVEQLDAITAQAPDDDRRSRGPLGCFDAAASVLVLAGLPAEAARAERLRNQCLDGARRSPRRRRHRRPGAPSPGAAVAAAWAGAHR